MFFKKFLNSIKLFLLFRTEISSTEYRDVQYRVPRCRICSVPRCHDTDREGIYTVCDELREDLEKSTKRSRSLPVSLQIMIALRYYASGSYMNVIGDAYGVSKMSVSRCINIVSKCIANNIKNYIKFHMSVRERQVMYDFYDIKEFPLVLGAVDGTLIPIKSRHHLWTNTCTYVGKDIML